MTEMKAGGLIHSSLFHSEFCSRDSSTDSFRIYKKSYMISYWDWFYHGVTEQTFIESKLANAEMFATDA